MLDINKPILVVGATGRHGGTGASVVRALRAHNMPVRALTRTADSRVLPLRTIGTEIATGDLHDRHSLLNALKEVETAFFAYPIARGIVEAAANFASAGRSTGLKRIVVMSMAVSHPDSPSHLGRAQWIAEDLFESAGFSCLHLRIAAFFFENIALLHRADILGDGVIRNSFGDIAVNWMAGEDAGKLAASALLHPGRFGDKTAVYPSGSESYSHAEIAHLIGRRIGRTVRHETVSQETWQNRLEALSLQDSRVNTDMASHISAVAAAIRRPLPVNNLFEEVTNEKPLSLSDAIASGCLSLK